MSTAEVVIPNLPHSTSYSQVDSWLTCGKRYQLERIVKVGRAPAMWFPGGTTFHHITEQYDRGLKTADEAVNPDYILKTLQTYLDEESSLPLDKWQVSASRSKQWPNGETFEWWVAALPGMIQQYIDWRLNTGWAILDIDGQPAIELEVDHYFGEYRFRGYIDRVFVTDSGVALAVDLKTGKQQPGADQLNAYAAALEAQFGIQVQWGAYYNARGGKLWEPVTVHVSPLMLERQIAAFRTAVEHDVFLPHQSAFCKSCGVREYCAVVGGSKAADYDPLLVGHYANLSEGE